MGFEYSTRNRTHDLYADSSKETISDSQEDIKANNLYPMILIEKSGLNPILHMGPESVFQKRCRFLARRHEYSSGHPSPHKTRFSNNCCSNYTPNRTTYSLASDTHPIVYKPGFVIPSPLLLLSIYLSQPWSPAAPNSYALLATSRVIILPLYLPIAN